MGVVLYQQLQMQEITLRILYSSYKFCYCAKIQAKQV